MTSFSTLERVLKARLFRLKKDRPVGKIITDSRKPVINDDVIFFAIKGARHDGHDFLVDLYEKGVRQFVVEKPGSDLLLPEANVIEVENSIAALQSLAGWHRQKFEIPVVAVTGSNGKTIVKEWLFQMLQYDENVFKSPASYNSQTGVPLSLWQLKDRHTLAIIEAGISMPGEMEKLQEIIKPTVGIFTNIGSAHDEGFANIEEKIAEKLKLFKDVKCLIYCKDSTLIDEAVVEAGIPSFTWGVNASSDLQFSRTGNTFTFIQSDKSATFQIPFQDAGSVENCLQLIAFLRWRKYSFDVIQERISRLRGIPMRLEMKEGVNDCQIIDDTYNNDLLGLRISLDFLYHQKHYQKKTLIFSDVLQSGAVEKDLVNEIAETVNASGLSYFIAVGPVLSRAKQLFTLPAIFFDSTDDFLQKFDIGRFEKEIILIKGARSFGFERIVFALQRKVHGTIMEIDLGALVHNLNYFRSKIHPKTKIMVMIKAFAYGSGSLEVASLLQFHKVDYLGVAYADEGVELRKRNVSIPIMVMNPSEDAFDSILHHNLEPEIYSFGILNRLISYLKDKPCTLHIKVDTGMHRLGFGTEDVNQLAALLSDHKNLRVASIFSHLAAQDEREHDEFTMLQAKEFEKFATALGESLGYKPLWHLVNSSGTLRHENLHFDMIRLGIGLYGGLGKSYDELQPVATLKTFISQIREVDPKETVGYSRKGRLQKKSKIATLAIGYADGFSRGFGNGVGRVLVKGQYASVVGNVCMDMTMIDVTGIDVKEGDEVIIFGNDLLVEDVAASINTISYEILTSTGSRVKRIFLSEGI